MKDIYIYTQKHPSKKEPFEKVMINYDHLISKNTWKHLKSTICMLHGFKCFEKYGFQK